MKIIAFLCIILGTVCAQAQQDSLLITYEQFLVQVYQYHPIAQQIRLKQQEAEAYLQKARGGFDPKLMAQWDNKQFDKKNYYQMLRSYLKVPIWAGIEAEAGYQYTNGTYLNPENKLPTPGQAYLGLKVPLLKGLWTNERQLALQQAKVLISANEAAIQSHLNNLLFEAGYAYWEWVQVYNSETIVQQSLINAQKQFEATKEAFIQGAQPAIDTLKAFIRIQDRQLLLNNTQLEVQNKVRTVSTYLWDEQQQPVQIPATAYPVTLNRLNNLPLDNALLDNSVAQLNQHPDVLAYQFKLQNLEFERRLKVNQLLPKLDLKYNFLSAEHVNFFKTTTSTPVQNYKIGIQFSMPIFLRKERAALSLIKLKAQSLTYKLSDKRRTLQAKIENHFNTVQTFAQQTEGYYQMIDNYQTLLQAERVKLELGESSIFLVNTRENQLFEAQLKLVKQQTKYFKARTKFFGLIANLVPN